MTLATQKEERTTLRLEVRGRYGRSLCHHELHYVHEEGEADEGGDGDQRDQR